MKRTVVTLIALLIATGMITAQQGDTLIQYTPDFKFRDGIYLNFDMVKSNNPIPKAKLFTSVDYNDKDFFDQVISSEKIYFYDNMGVRQEIDKELDLGICTQRRSLCQGAEGIQPHHFLRLHHPLRG